MTRLSRLPAVWLSALLCWFGVLWFISSLEGSPLAPQLFPHFDKLQHFGYFLGGGFLLTGWNFLRKPEQASWRRLIITTAIVIAAIGFIDEWHQCFTPGRSGGDPGDWLADLLGGTAGAFVLKTIHRRLS
jgi:VanZ family protein